MSLIKISHIFLGKKEGCIYVNPDYVVFVNTANNTVGLVDGTKVDTDTKGCDALMEAMNPKAENPAFKDDAKILEEFNKPKNVKENGTRIVNLKTNISEDDNVGRLGRWD